MAGKRKICEVNTEDVPQLGTGDSKLNRTDGNFDDLPPLTAEGEELIGFLERKVSNLPLQKNRIRHANVNIHPHDLTRSWKDPKRPNDKNGVWKKIGGAVDVLDRQSKTIGKIRRFNYFEKNEKGENMVKSEWCMQVYSLPIQKKDGWVLCRIFKEISEHNGPNGGDSLSRLPMKSRELPNTSISQRVDVQVHDNGSFSNMATGTRQNTGLDSERFSNLVSGPTQINGHVLNSNQTYGQESGFYYNMASGPYGGVSDNGNRFPVQNCQSQSQNTNQGRDSANSNYTTPSFMPNVQEHNPNMSQGLYVRHLAGLPMLNKQTGLDSGRFHDMAGGLMHNIRVPNTSISHRVDVQVHGNGSFSNMPTGTRQNTGLDSERFSNLVSGPAQINGHVLNSNQTYGLESGFYYNMASGPYGGVSDNGNRFPVQNCQSQSQNTNQGRDSANSNYITPSFMPNVREHNPNTSQGLHVRHLASLPMLNNVQQTGLDSGRFHDMAGGPMHNIRVPNTSISQRVDVQVHGNGSFSNMATGTRQNTGLESERFSNLNGHVLNSNQTYGLESGFYYNMASGPYRGVSDNGNIFPVQNCQSQSQNTNQGRDSANSNYTTHSFMPNVQEHNPNISQGLYVHHLASLPMLNNVQQTGLDSGRFHDMAGGPMHNIRVPDPSIAQGQKSGPFYNRASGPHEVVSESASSLNMQHEGPGTAYNNLSLD